MRLSGRAPIKQFIYIPYHEAEKPEESLVYDLYSAVDTLIYSSDKKFIPVDTSSNSWDNLLYELSSQAPNLTRLRSNLSRRSLTFAAIGILLQVTVISMSAVITFYLRWFKATRPFSPATGFGIFVTGTVRRTSSFRLRLNYGSRFPSYQHRAAFLLLR